MSGLAIKKWVGSIAAPMTFRTSFRESSLAPAELGSSPRRLRKRIACSFGAVPRFGLGHPSFIISKQTAKGETQSPWQDEGVLATVRGLRAVFALLLLLNSLPDAEP